MNKLENSQEIKCITMKPIAFTKCAIGQDWYKNELEILFVPDAYYPDYEAVHQWIMRCIDGQELNIEDVVDIIYTYLQSEYHPLKIKVTDKVSGCKTHFDVIVEK